MTRSSRPPPPSPSSLKPKLKRGKMHNQKPNPNPARMKTKWSRRPDPLSTLTRKANPPPQNPPASESSESESGSESREDEYEDEGVPEAKTRPVNNDNEKPQPSADGASEPPKVANIAAAEKSHGKALFQRIWSFEDELAVLNGMAQFQSERGPIKLTIAGIANFYALIQKELSIDVSKNQLLDKIRKLKGKCLGAAYRANSGWLHRFQKPHDESVYELGKKIWVLGFDENDRKSDGGVRRSKRTTGVGMRSSKRNFPFLKASAESMGRFAEEKLAKIHPREAVVLEKRFKKIKLEKMKHQTLKMDLLNETIELVMEGVERATI